MGFIKDEEFFCFIVVGNSCLLCFLVVFVILFINGIKFSFVVIVFI